MAKIALALVLSLLLVLAVQSAARGDALSPVADQLGQAAASAKGAAQSMGTAAKEAAEDAKDTASSWSDWFTGKLKGFGLYNSDSDQSEPAAAPVSA
ncbi:SANT domain-containing protein [Psidium guajava]|nr:SANT domain-containing protein [Psidium guajava]